MENHAFVICAYKKSPYLEECIRSLLAQSVRSDILICTSTPSEYLNKLAGKYKIPVYVRDGKSGIREDWLFAWETAGKDHRLVTIAHQDDRYHRDYVKHLLAAYEKYPDMTVFCSDYAVLKTEEQQAASGVWYPVHTELKALDPVRLVKILLRLPLRFPAFSDRAFLKKSALVFGNSICCPSCTYNHDRIGDSMFDSEFSFVLDWDNLYTLAGRPGRFVCAERPLIAYRVHDGAETKECIRDDRRRSEETAMFRKMWPGWAVKLLMFFYQKAYGAYGE